MPNLAPSFAQDMPAGERWGARDISRDEAEAFAEALRIQPDDRRRVAETLLIFPHACQVRGMFFDGLVNVIRAERDNAMATRLMERAGVKGRAIPFGFLPHRDFYKLYFVAADALYPGVPLDRAMERISETFYPVFRDSMVGRTLSALLGSDPQRVLERLVDAYNLSVQDNEHAVRAISPRSMLWDCRVEPSPFYASTFRGIVRGTMRSHGVPQPTIETVSRLADGPQNVRWVFGVSW